jgi:hypothetical protein
MLKNLVALLGTPQQVFENFYFSSTVQQGCEILFSQVQENKGYMALSPSFFPRHIAYQATKLFYHKPMLISSEIKAINLAYTTTVICVLHIKNSNDIASF